MCHTPVFIKEVLNKPKHFTSRKIRLTLASFSLSVSPSIHLSDRVSFHPNSRLLKLNNYWNWTQSGFGAVFLFLLILHFCHSFIFFFTSRSSSVALLLSRAVRADTERERETNFGARDNIWSFIYLFF